MTIPLFAAFGQTVFMLLLGFVATFLILLVLVQRGRGGGLAGALGGMGGSSAFGAKAGDLFTKVTVVAATVWIVLCIAATKMTPSEDSLLNTKVDGPLSTATAGPVLDAPANSDVEKTADDASDETSAGGESVADGTGGTGTGEESGANRESAETSAETTETK